MFSKMRNFKWSAYLSPAYGAALALIVIQAGIGVLYKFAQHDGGYAFSPSSSITISESLKFLLSAAFFYRECLERHTPSSLGYADVETASRRSSHEGQEKMLLNDLSEDGPIDDDSPGSSETARSDLSTVVLNAESRMLWSDYIFYCLNEVSADTQYGFFKLALLYALINNTVFVLYKLADPGTIQLIKSGITLVTALVLWFTLGTKIVKLQWIAILLQICGLVITQYNPQTGSSYPLTTYTVLMFQTFLSAVAGVYNQKLCKSEGASLHADNMVLYGSGVCCNLLIHIMTKIIKPSEPSFFTGYADWGAIMVIVSNVFIGLAITAVYKYADAVIKCFATAISTALLLYISPILFGVSMTAMVIPGTMVVFLATWLYMEGSPPKNKDAPAPTPPRLSFGPLTRLYDAISDKSPFKPNSRKLQLVVNTIFTLFIIGSLTIWNTRSTADPVPEEPIPVVIEEPVVTGPEILPEPVRNLTILKSPFENTLAYIRFNNHDRYERIPYTLAYEPFFHTVHVSIPYYPADRGSDFFVNQTHDSHVDTYTLYKGIAETMRIILEDSPELNDSPEKFAPDTVLNNTLASANITYADNRTQPNEGSLIIDRNDKSPIIDRHDKREEKETKGPWKFKPTRPAAEVEGLLLFHFDAWVDPLGFTDEDFSKIWFPGAWHSDPSYRCINDSKEYDWPWFKEDHHKKALGAMETIKYLKLDYVMPPHNQFCVGWSDIFYIPRAYFQDFITLANIFATHAVFMEVAIPTIVNIIDHTRKQHEHLSRITKIGDCFGNCCTTAGNTGEVLWHRCGHQLNHQDNVTVAAQMNRLQEEADALGMVLEDRDFEINLPLGKPIPTF